MQVRFRQAASASHRPALSKIRHSVTLCLTLAVLHICAAPSAQAQTNFQATPGNCEIVLQWIGSASSTGYNLSRATSLDGPYVQLAANYRDTQYNDASTSQPIFAYTDTELTNGTTYYYQVSAAGSGATQSTSTSPNGPPGWVQQHRKDVFGSIIGSSDYDLTGLSAVGYYRNGQTSPSVQVYLGMDNSLDMILEYSPDADTFGEKVEGTSTYTWEWFPPANPTGLHNDPSKTLTDPSQPFPAPKLYVIATADPFISANPQSDSLYFKATGSVKDGLTSNWNPTLSITGGPSAQPVQVPDNSQLPRHGILTATPGASSQKVDAKISPFAQLSLTNPEAASGEIYLDISTYPLLLDLPNAFVRPDLWDSNADSSNNQFLYSGDTQAILDVPARISTGNDPFTDDLDWLINTGKAPKVTWLFDAVPAQNPSMIPLTDTNGSSTYLGDLLKGKAAGIIPTTVDASNNPVLRFLGLPSSIRGFGNHTITLGVQNNSASSSYSQSQTAYIQTFFPGVKSNYPSAPADQANLG